MNIGIKLKNLRKVKGLTQNDLATKAGISNTFLSDIEVGRTEPSLRTLSKLTSVLDVDLEFLFKKN